MIVDITDRIIEQYRKDCNIKDDYVLGGDEQYLIDKIVQLTIHPKQSENVVLYDVVDSVCFEYVDGINMDCAKCGQPKYRHK